MLGSRSLVEQPKGVGLGPTPCFVKRAGFRIPKRRADTDEAGEEATMVSRTDSPVVERVRSLVAPIVADLKLDLYDVEQRGGTLRITVDTPVGASGGVDLDTLALATRLVSRELDHADPVPGRYTLEVTSPGVERSLRTPAHFRREIGKSVNVRLADVAGDERRVEGVLVAADDTAATVEVADVATGAKVERVIPYDHIDRARTVFVWGPAPRPGRSKTARQKNALSKAARPKSATKQAGGRHESNESSNTDESKESS
jgi:ribosome maturation factor RimP